MVTRHWCSSVTWDEDWISLGLCLFRESSDIIALTLCQLTGWLKSPEWGALPSEWRERHLVCLHLGDPARRIRELGGWNRPRRDTHVTPGCDRWMVSYGRQEAANQWYPETFFYAVGRATCCTSAQFPIWPDLTWLRGFTLPLLWEWTLIRCRDVDPPHKALPLVHFPQGNDPTQIWELAMLRTMPLADLLP